MSELEMLENEHYPDKNLVRNGFLIIAACIVVVIVSLIILIS